MTDKEKLERYHTALVSLFHMLKTPVPAYLHQKYINEVLEEVGENLER